MVKSALKLWIGGRMSEEAFCLLEDNPLGILAVNDLNSYHHGQCPVPPELDNQLDTPMILEMIKMKKDILRKVKRMIEARNRNSWYENFLTVFILVCILEYSYRENDRYWRLHVDIVSSTSA